MDPMLYKAAVEGNADYSNLMQHAYELNNQTTRNNNTVLHIAALFGCVEFARNAASLCPTLVLRVNVRNETALHIAAAEGYPDVTRVLIECAASLQHDLEPGDTALVMMVDSDEDTALHKAVRNDVCEVTKVLVESGPEFAYPPNRAEETPLYLAAENGCEFCLSEILNSSPSPSYGGPKGRTALHAAVAANHEGCVEMLLDWKRSLCEEVDEYGWTPLHFAALFGRRKLIKLMLSINRSLAYVQIHEDEATALHIAADQGQVPVMQELILHCPDCWEMLNIKGQNVLHIAIANNQKNVIEFILDYPMLSPLIGERDANGNTPLHLLATSNCYEPRLLHHPRTNKMAFNNDNLNPLDLAYTDKYSSSWGLIRRSLRKSSRFGLRNVVRDEAAMAAEAAASEKDQKIREALGKDAERRLIVASLITTVTFAAGFTLPGGFKNNGNDEGMAVLGRKAAFIAFVIADAIALVCSTSAAFVYFLKVDFINRHKIIRHYILAKFLITISMGAMVIAFFTGMVAVLEKSQGLALAVAIICCSSFLVYYHELRPALRSLKGRSKFIYSEQTKRRGRPTYMIWGTRTPPPEVVRIQLLIMAKCHILHHMGQNKEKRFYY